MNRKDWIRIDKETAKMMPANGVSVLRAASAYFWSDTNGGQSAQEVLDSGRFQTPFAIYSRVEHLSVDEIERFQVQLLGAAEAVIRGDDGAVLALKGMIADFTDNEPAS